jgi:hypothetical protein
MRTYISRQLARSKGPLEYRKAKQGFYLLVNHLNKLWFMGCVQGNFFLFPFDESRGQSEQLKVVPS